MTLARAVAAGSRRAAAAFGLAAGTLLLASCSATSSTAPLVVAAFNPFSGGDAAFGPEMLAGCAAAATLVDDAGGVLGHTLKCQAVDTRGDAADAVPAADKMLATTTNLVGVLGPSADEAQATVPLINAVKIPMFADTGEAAFDRSSYQYFYRITPADDVKGYALALWAHDAHYSRAAAVFGNDIGAQSDLPTLTSAFQKLGGTLALDEKVVPGLGSYRTEVERLIGAQPQVIFTEADPQTDATFLNELQQLHGLLPVIGTDTTLEAGWLQAVRGAIGAQSLARYYVGMQPATVQGGAAVSIYQKAVGAGQYAADPYAMNDYDSVNLIALAMLAANSTDPAAFAPRITRIASGGPGAVTVGSFAQGRDALKAGHSIRYVGASGPIDFDRWHNSSGAFQVVDGQGRVLGAVSAARIAGLER